MKSGDKVGRFSVDVEIVNYTDVVKANEGLIDPAAIRRKTICGVVDSGAAKMVLPASVVEPKRDSALIGAIVLEDMDFLVDGNKQRLVPRDPDNVVSEIE